MNNLKHKILALALSVCMILQVATPMVYATDGNITVGDEMTVTENANGSQTITGGEDKTIPLTPATDVEEIQLTPLTPATDVKPRVEEIVAEPVTPTLEEPTVDPTNIYGNGYDLKIIAGTEADKTTVQWKDGESWTDLTGATNADLSEYSIYGGAENADVANTSIEMTGGKVHMVYGGGLAMGENQTANVTGNTNVTISGGMVYMVFGGGGVESKGSAAITTTNATVTTANVTISGGTIYSNVYCGYVKDGGNANVTTAIISYKLGVIETGRLYLEGFEDGGTATVGAGIIMSLVSTDEVSYYKNAKADTLDATVTKQKHGAITYQWYSNTTNTTVSGTEISDEINGTYTPPTTTVGTTYYYCVVTNTESEGKSEPLVVTSNIANIKVINQSSGGGSSKPKPPTPQPPVTDGDNTVTEVPVKPTISGGNATVTIPDSTVTEALDKVVEDAINNGTKPVIEITVDTDKNLDSVETVISGGALGNIAENNADLVISSSVATVTIPSDVAKNISDKAKGKKVKIILNKEITLTDAQKAILVNNLDTTPILKVSVMIGDEKMTDFGSDITITIPYTKSADVNLEDLVIWYITDDGKITVIDGEVTDKTATFKTNHNSIYAVAEFPFTDVENGAWYYDATAFAFANEIMSGTTDTTFAPNTSMTRGMFVTVLGRLADVKTDDYKTSKFADVKSSEYYAPYVAWANEKGIVNGITDTEFAPNSAITREQMAVILSNYIEKYEIVMPTDKMARPAFADADKISDWAVLAVNQMQNAEILSGKEGNNFDPQGTATRAEVATMLQRFMQKTK